MPWQQAHIHTLQQYVDPLTEWLEGQGACSVTYQPADQQLLLEPDPQTTPLWDRVVVTALFEMNCNINALQSAIIAQLGQKAIDGFEIEILADQAWERAWLERFQPMQFGRSLWVCPTSMPLPPEASGATVVYLDPGLAFGTGTHPTTSLCLACLESMDLKGRTVVDYGCGSGILAVAAAKLGASKVWAIDHDVQAIQATRDNSVKNDVIESVFPLHSKEMKGVVLAADVVLANILAQPLISLAPTLSAFVNEGGELVLSGILKGQYKEVLSAYEPWFSFELPIMNEEWVCLRGKKNEADQRGRVAED